MANDLSSEIDILFDDVVAEVNATNMTAKNVDVYKHSSGSLQQSGQTFYRPVDMLTEVEDGRTVTYNDIVELTVPATLTDAHIRNVPVQLVGSEMNSPHLRERIKYAAVKMLNNKVDTVTMDAVADYGTLAVVNSALIDSYDDAAVADALMLEQQVSKGDRKMILNPRMSNNLAGNLASRGTMQGAPMDAYTRSMLPPIGGFDTFRNDYGKSLVGSSGTGYLVNGAAQVTDPTAKDGNGLPVDNRSQTLTVDTGSGAAVGDVFTIAGVFSCGAINKQSTGQLRTFRITAINGADWTVWPAIIPADGATAGQKAYGNVNTSPADNAAITILNTVTNPVSIFYERSAVEIVTADWYSEEFAATGKKVRKATTDSGIQIVMLADSDQDNLLTKYRMFVWFNVTILNPMACGIMLESQT